METPRRLTTEEIWATVLAVFGGLAVLVPLIVIALDRPAESGGEGRMVGLGAAEEVGVADLRKELLEAQNRVAGLSGELEAAKIEAEASARSAQRAWVQLREAAGEPENAAPIEGGGEEAGGPQEEAVAPEGDPGVLSGKVG